MQVVLAMFRSDGDRRSFSLHKDLTLVGRREDCDLRIPLGEISRKHCRFINDGETLRVEDLGSSNGTFHNGQRVQEAVLQPGDTVQVGSIAFVVQIDGVPDDDSLQPVRAADAMNSQGSGTPLDDSAADEAAIAASVAGDDSGVIDADIAASVAADDSGAAIQLDEPADGDDFDPMAILEAGDSQSGAAAPPASDDSAGLDIDLEEPEHST